MEKKILVLGGAGFIGSNIVEHFVKKKYNVTIIDGLLKHTGGRIENLKNVINNINFIYSKIENVRDIDNLLESSDIIIDTMAWTSHLKSIDNPYYDLKLNCYSHLSWLQYSDCLREKKIFYLSSRSVYGNPDCEIITEDICPQPYDIQGVHKLCSENYFKFYSRVNELDVVVLRIPNSFGPKQKLKGDDVGLIGNFIQASLQDKKIEIFGNNRIKTFAYVEDIVNAIDLLIETDYKGYNIYNIGGFEILLKKLADLIIKITGLGSIVVKDMPDKIKNVDSGNLPIDDSKLKKIIGEYKKTDLETALTKTIKYFYKEMTI